MKKPSPCPAGPAAPAPAPRRPSRCAPTKPGLHPAKPFPALQRTPTTPILQRTRTNVSTGAKGSTRKAYSDEGSAGQLGSSLIRKGSGGPQAASGSAGWPDAMASAYQGGRGWVGREGGRVGRARQGPSGRLHLCQPAGQMQPPRPARDGWQGFTRVHPSPAWGHALSTLHSTAAAPLPSPAANPTSLPRTLAVFAPGGTRSGRLRSAGGCPGSRPPAAASPPAQP